MQIRGKWIEANAVGGTKIRLANNESLRARNAANSADINLFRLNTSDVFEFPAAPLLKLGLVIEDPGAGVNTVTINAPSGLAASYTLTLPTNDGAAGEYLQTDGSGVLSWQPVTGGSGEVNTASNVGSGSGVFKIKTGVDLEFKSLIGTQGVTIVSNADDLTFSLPGTTKGDILVHNGTTLVRLPVGANGELLEADSTTATGIKWAAGSGGGGANTALSNLTATSVNKALVFDNLALADAYENQFFLGDFNTTATIAKRNKLNTGFTNTETNSFNIISSNILWDGAWTVADKTDMSLGVTISGNNCYLEPGASNSAALTTQIFAGGITLYGGSFSAGALTNILTLAMGVQTGSAVLAGGNFTIASCPVGSSIGSLNMSGAIVTSGSVNIPDNLTVTTFNPGNVEIRSGDFTSGTNSTVPGGQCTPRIDIATGRVQINGVNTTLQANSGEINIKTGENQYLPYGLTGQITIETGFSYSELGSTVGSGAVVIKTGFTGVGSPDGTGPSGNIELQTGENSTQGNSGNILITAGVVPLPSQKGNLIIDVGEITATNSISFWKTAAFGPAAFTAAATSESIALFTLPARASIDLVLIRNQTAFTKAGLTALTMEVGVAGDTDGLASPFNCFSAPSDTSQQISGAGGTILNWNAPVDLLLTARSVGANLNAMTAGRAIVSVKYSVISDKNL